MASSTGNSGSHSRYQQGVIQRYYEHKDTIALQRLSEMVSDIYLAEGAKAKKLWDTARAALMKIAGDDPRTAKVLAERNVQALARLVNELSAAARSSVQASSKASAVAAAEPIVGETNVSSLALGAPQADQSNAPTAPPAASATPAVSSAPTPEQLKSAMKHFRKRLKLTRLDEESKLGRNPMSSGKKSSVVAIMAPREFPQPVWDELVRQGKLKRSGAFYELVE